MSCEMNFGPNRIPCPCMPCGCLRRSSLLREANMCSPTHSLAPSSRTSTTHSRKAIRDTATCLPVPTKAASLCPSTAASPGLPTKEASPCAPVDGPVPVISRASGYSRDAPFERVIVLSAISFAQRDPVCIPVANQFDHVTEQIDLK